MIKWTDRYKIPCDIQIGNKRIMLNIIDTSCIHAGMQAAVSQYIHTDRIRYAYLNVRDGISLWIRGATA